MLRGKEGRGKNKKGSRRKQANEKTVEEAETQSREKGEKPQVLRKIVRPPGVAATRVKPKRAAFKTARMAGLGSAVGPLSRPEHD